MTCSFKTCTNQHWCTRIDCKDCNRNCSRDKVYYYSWESLANVETAPYVPFYKILGPDGVMLRESFDNLLKAAAEGRCIADGNRGRNVHILKSVGMWGPSSDAPTWYGAPRT